MINFSLVLDTFCLQTWLLSFKKDLWVYNKLGFSIFTDFNILILTTAVCLSFFETDDSMYYNIIYYFYLIVFQIANLDFPETIPGLSILIIFLCFTGKTIQIYLKIRIDVRMKTRESFVKNNFETSKYCT